jgi:hypothetical protein
MRISGRSILRSFVGVADAMINAVSAVPNRAPLRAAGMLATVLCVATSCAEAPTAGTPTPETSTPDWAPFRGTLRMSRTWGHPGGHPFPAVDFEVPAGESVEVHAAGPGTIFASSGECPDTTPSGRHAGCNGGNGNFVDIIHPDGRRSRYLHLREGSVAVQPGEHVCRGCLIGRTGWSGNVVPPGPAGAHLHYEELVGYLLVSPGEMLAQGRAGLVSYPSPGRSWQELGVKRPLVVNERFPSVDPAPRGSCLGWVPTLVGTGDRDTIRGTRGHDVILAGPGEDRILAGSGEDRICGGAGDDVLIGGGHPDHVSGGSGDDTCYQGEASGLENAAPGSVGTCEHPEYVLTVTTGGPVITSQPAGISCPSDCSERFVTHTSVLLSAAPRGVVWAGCDTSPTALVCRVEMSRDRTIRG